MDRRQFLRFAGLSSGIIAGCIGNPDGAESSQPTGSPRTDVTTATSQQTPRGTATPGEDADVIHVSPTGTDDNTGAETDPLGTVQAALDMAHPGDVIALHPGVYTGPSSGDEPVGETTRAGEPGQPITIMGPPEAIVRGPPVERASNPLLKINHSHVHVLGVTLDGLGRPEREAESQWYRRNLVAIFPPPSHDRYLTDVKIKPHAAGNARRKLIGAFRTNQLEIGEFQLIGPAGVDYLYGDVERYELAEVVSLGISLNNIGKPHYPWEEPDQSHDVHVHHIANLEGYHHSELVKTHLGMYDVTVEFCTDTGGSGRKEAGGAGVTVGSARTTVRWCILNNGRDHGIAIASPSQDQLDALEGIPEERFPGVNNAVYGNRLLDNAGKAIAFNSTEGLPSGPEYQQYLCGNEYDGATDGEPGASCSDEVPESSTIGHTGGDSPFE